MTSAGASRPFTEGINIGVLTRIFHRDLVDDVLHDTHRAGQRTRLLPGRVTVYFVLALCLFCEEAYEEVMRKLVHGLQFLGNWSGNWRVPTSSAMTQARDRLGEEPLAELFDRVAVPMARPATIGAWFHGLRVMAVDGVLFDVPDTDDNAAAFAKASNSAGPGPFPQVRLVGLAESGTHAIVAAAFDTRTVDERALFARLIDDLEPGTIVLCDRGFYSYQLWSRAAATGAQLLWRLKRDLKIPVLQVLPDGSYLSELLPRIAKNNYRRGKMPNMPDRLRIPVRVVEYAVTNRDGETETITVMTTILDHELAPAAELAALYQQRWEFELTLDEVEVHQMPYSGCCVPAHPNSYGKKSGGYCSPITPSARSCEKPPTTSTGTSIACHSSEHYGSFAARLEARRVFPPHRLTVAIRDTLDEILERRNPPRRHRTYPRVAKRGISRAPKKRAHHRGVRHDCPPDIKIIEPVA